MSWRIPGQPEPGDKCPGCNYPILEKGELVMEIQPPSTGYWSCTHCGWPHTLAGEAVSMGAPRHGPFDNQTPRPGHP